jgi:hypothetical protein
MTMKITIKARSQVNRIMISMSTSDEELWETAIKLEPGFAKIEKQDSGVLVAFDIDGQQMSVHAPTFTKRAMLIDEDNMKDKEVITGTPDGETAIVEQNPTNTDITVDQGGGGGLHPGIVEHIMHSEPSYASQRP